MPSFEWTDQDRADVAAAAQWIKDAGHVNQNIVDDDALAHPLCKSIPHLSPELVNRVPGLAMLYRTPRSWWNDPRRRSAPEEAWTYAYQCVIGFKLWAATSGRILHHPSPVALREELGEALSNWAQPSCRTECEVASGSDSESGSDSGGEPMEEFVFWDSVAFDRMLSYGKDLGLPPCHVRGRGWIERRRQEQQAVHRKEVDTLVQNVRKLKSAKGNGGHLHPWVREPLQALCQVSSAQCEWEPGST